MKRSACCALLLCLSMSSVARAQFSAEREILPLLHQQMVAANAHDTDRFLATYLHDPQLVFVINGLVIRGFDRLREEQLKWWSQTDVVYTEQGPPEFLRLSDDAMLVTQQLTSRRAGPDGKPTQSTFAVSSVWRHSRDGWRVVYAHESSAR